MADDDCEYFYYLGRNFAEASSPSNPIEIKSIRRSVGQKLGLAKKFVVVRNQSGIDLSIWMQDGNPVHYFGLSPKESKQVFVSSNEIHVTAANANGIGKNGTGDEISETVRAFDEIIIHPL